MVGSGNIDSGWFFDNVVTNKEAYLGFCLTGSGDNARVGSGNRTTTVYSNDFLNKDIKAAICMSWGSHHGDWDHSQNLLRAPLTSSTSGLACSMYAYNPSGTLHTMGLGGTLGEAIRLKQNNTTTYAQYNPGDSGGVHIALMGDPTIRLFAAKPPSALAIAADSNHHPVLSWQASADSPVLGYYVYRAADPNGPLHAFDARSRYPDHLDRQQHLVRDIHLPGQGREVGNNRQRDLRQYQPGYFRAPSPPRQTPPARWSSARHAIARTRELPRP